MLFLSSIVIPMVLFIQGCTQVSRGEGLEARLAAVTEVIVDVPSLTPAYTTDCQEAWVRITTTRGPDAYLTLNAKKPANSTNSGKWTPHLPQDGYYRVEAYIPVHTYPVTWCTSGRTVDADTADARYEIHHASGITTKTSSQRPLADQWLDLGAYPFKAGTSGYVFLDDLNGETDFSSTISYATLLTKARSSALSNYCESYPTAPSATPSPVYR
jgi:hypothetical protein